MQDCVLLPGCVQTLPAGPLAAAACRACRAAPLAVIGRVNSTIASVGADVDVLLGKASREELLPVYSEVKGLVCCMVPDIFASMWTGLTFAGGRQQPWRGCRLGARGWLLAWLLQGALG